MMRKSRKLDSILDECLERLLVKGETPEQCLQDFPEHADELKPLLETAMLFDKASAVQPSPAFRESARGRFLSALRETERKKSRPFFNRRWQPRWAVALAITLVIVLAGSGTVAAADNSMPDEPLYPVKLATEQVRLVFTPSALGKAEFYARMADKRVAEISSMAAKGKSEQIEKIAWRLNAHLDKIAVLAASRGGMAGVTTAPATETQPAKEAPAQPEQVRDSRSPRFKPDARSKLREIMARNARNHPAQLDALLKKVPESARPALLQAISASKRGYEKAIKSLD